MPKVIQFIKSKLELHRGKKSISSNPYSYRSNLKRKEKRVLNWTLDSFHLSPRCSSTYPLNFSFRKKSSAKEISKNFEMKVNSISKFNYEITNQKYARILGSVSTIAFVLLLTLTVLPVVHNDNSADAATGTATQSSTTVSVSTATASVDLTATSTDGTFATSTGSGIASFDVTTTNYTGYTLTIEADDDNKQLTNGSGGVFNSIDSVMDEKTFDDSTYNGKWGYKPSKMNGVENVGFWPSPTTTATTLDTTKVANSTANTYTIALGARASASQAAGTYSKTVTITATSNPANYSITYADNTGKAATNLPDATTSTTSGTSIALSNVTPSKTGFVFGGWCSTAPTVAADYTTTCSGTTYQAGGTYGIDQTTANTVTLYALWTIPTYTITLKPTTGVASVKISGNGVNYTCSNTSGCAVTTKLTYGKNYTITATMSDGYDFAAWSPSGAGTIANITSSSTTFTVGEGETTISAVASGAAAQAVKVNFAAAGTGGTVGVSSVTFKETATGTTVGTVSTSGGTVKLDPGVGYTITANTSSDTYGVSSYNGSGNNPFAINNASYGTLAPTTSNVTYFTPNSSSASAVITVTSCVKTISGTMQTYTTNINQLCDNATGTLTDSRDSHSYTVGVVTANNGGAARTLWMTKNLSIGCNTNGTINSIKLTSATSNVSSDYTTPATSGHSNTYTDSKVVCSDNANYGAWYNYVAASAGTINTNGDNATTATSSVCPKGWALPSHSQISAAASNKTAFSPVTGGCYDGGTLGSTGLGYWWSNFANGGTTRWYLRYNGPYLYTAYNSRYGGFYVRCVRS